MRDGRNAGVHGAGGDQVHVLHHGHGHVEPRVTVIQWDRKSVDINTGNISQGSDLHAWLGRNITILGWKQLQNSKKNIEGKIYYEDQSF